MENLVEIIISIAKILGGIGLCYLASLATRLGVAHLLCRHPNLSDDKAKYITQMFSKDHHIFRK